MQSVTVASPSAARPSHRKPTPAAAVAPVWALVCLALLAVLVQLRGVWAVEVLLVIGLLVLPGVLLLRALRVPGSTVLAFPAYLPAASLVVLLGSGLVVDLLGPLIGVAEPLRAEPLLVGLEIICAALVLAGRKAGRDTDIPWHSLARRARFAWPMVLPLVAAAGALRLNNGQGGAVALVAVFAACAALVTAVVLAARLNATLLTVVIYAVALALIWGFSLRGDLVYGFDIASEYHAMQQTVLAGVWHTSHVGDAYGAMLSVTVLPAELHAVSGLPALLVFKVVYPALCALLPVVIFHLARRVISQRWAFAAAAFTVAQETFFQQMPGLARQEIAILLFAVLVVALLDDRLPRRAQMVLVALLGLGMAVSHYSTTYFAIVMLAVALVLQWIVSWFRNGPRVSVSLVIAVVTVAACAGVWYGLVTQSASNVSQFASVAAGQGLDLLPSGTGGGLISRYLQAGSSASVSAAEYARQVHQYYAAQVPYVHPLPDASNPAYALRDSTESSAPVRWAFGLASLSHAQLLIAQLVNVVAALGALFLALRRDSSALRRQVGLLGFATLAILLLVRLSATAAAAYNPDRAFLQALVVLGIGLCWVMEWLSGVTKWRQVTVVAVAAAAIAVLVASNSGLAGAALGGGTGTNLANSGGDYSFFDMSAPELAAASWLGKAAPPGQLIYADRYAQLRLLAMNGSRAGMLSDVTPLTLDQHAWIYADRTNVVERTGMAFFDNESASYAFPFPFLDANYNLVYSDGTSEVFSG